MERGRKGKRKEGRGGWIDRIGIRASTYEQQSQVVRSQYKYTMSQSRLKVTFYLHHLRTLDILQDP